MKLIIERINAILFVAFAILTVLGFVLMAVGNDQLSTDVLLIVAVIAPIFLAIQGVKFIFENQVRKAFMSILLLSVICLLSILFVFAGQ